jgi:hypothetical protein
MTADRMGIRHVTEDADGISGSPALPVPLDPLDFAATARKAAFRLSCCLRVTAIDVRLASVRLPTRPADPTRRQEP